MIIRNLFILTLLVGGISACQGTTQNTTQNTNQTNQNKVAGKSDPVKLRPDNEKADDQEQANVKPVPPPGANIAPPKNVKPVPPSAALGDRQAVFICGFEGADCTSCGCVKGGKTGWVSYYWDERLGWQYDSVCKWNNKCDPTKGAKAYDVAAAMEYRRDT